jgi:drug/metabolite transporter (DMT)-like permease
MGDRSNRFDAEEQEDLGLRRMDNQDLAGRMRLIGGMALVLLAFAANPLLCRMALDGTDLDPASFTLIRLASGAFTLWLILQWQGRGAEPAGSQAGAISLFIYAAALSYAYVTLTAGIGTLLLFGAVQVTMISVGLIQGEHLRLRQVMGVLIAALGLVILLAPGATAPSWEGAILMILSGLAWGVYSLLGRRSLRPVALTTGNFLGAVALATVLSALTAPWVSWDLRGAAYAVASGAIASGIGYAIWYSVLPALRTTQAAVIQLSVPVLTAVGGIVFLGESLTLRLILSSAGILGGIALVFIERRQQFERM